ncbi:hypothetical protein ABZP36_017006 [Zizania latifolia]
MAPIGVEVMRGQTVAVDTYSWLHKGALSCGDRLCKGIPTTRHIEYCMHRVNMLRHHGVKPILVFDGGLLPMKGDQETKRARSRKENLERAREHEYAGNSRAAFECYQKAVDITPRIAFELIQVLKQEKVEYIVAPYEADAQMTFLSVNKLVDAVITEDSDLIPFGCSRIIFKMDRFGQGVEFQITRLERNRELDFNGFTKQMLLEMCILSGCDYLPSLPGMGVKRAHALIQKLKSHEKVIKHLRYSAVSVPPQYEENFRKAIWAFQFQRVYDPVTEDIVHLSGIPHDISEDLDFLGPYPCQTYITVAKGIALGNIDPITKEPFEIKTESGAPSVDKVRPIGESIVPTNGKKRLVLPVQSNILTNYFCLASLEAKRKFRAPKVTPKQQILNGSLSSPRTEDSSTPESIEDLSLPENNIQASQCTSEHISSDFPQDDSINTASQCSSEHVRCDFPRGDLASVSPQCSSCDIGSDPPDDTDMEDTKVEVNNCNRSTMLADSCLDGNLPGISDPFLDSHNAEPSRAAPHYIQKRSVVSADRNITVGSYFKTANKRVYTNKGKGKIHDGGNCETGNWTLSGDQPRNTGDLLKRRKFSDLESFEDESFQPTTHESPPVVDEGCDTDSLDGINTNAEGSFGCNVSHVNEYSGIAEKSMDKFAELISSMRYAGSRASGLRAPLKDVKNTLPVRSVLRPPEQRFSSTAKKTARGPPSQSRFSSDATNMADSPDLSTFAYRRTTSFAHPDQGKTTHNSADAVDGPPDLRTFAYAPTRTTIGCLGHSRSARKAMCTEDSPPDLSTFAYKPMKSVIRRPDGSRFSEAAHKALMQLDEPLGAHSRRAPDAPANLLT